MALLLNEIAWAEPIVPPLPAPGNYDTARICCSGAGIRLQSSPTGIVASNAVGTLLGIVAASGKARTIFLFPWRARLRKVQ